MLLSVHVERVEEGAAGKVVRMGEIGVGNLTTLLRFGFLVVFFMPGGLVYVFVKEWISTNTRDQLQNTEGVSRVCIGIFKGYIPVKNVKALLKYGIV